MDWWMVGIAVVALVVWAGVRKVQRRDARLAELREFENQPYD